MSRTKSQLQTATAANAQEVLELARARNWNDASITKYASAAVLALLGVSSVPPKLAAPAVSVQYSAPKGKRKAKAQPKKPAFKAKGSVPVTLTHVDGEVLIGQLTLGQERKKLRGEGTTTDVRLTAEGFESKATMSAPALENLMTKGTRMGLNNRLYVVTLTQS